MSAPRLEEGTTLLHYRLVEPLSEGGMGVVWKAVDTTLDREVAIKVLPEAFANDPERLSRFEREAKLLASLSHPNVAAIYGLHEVEGIRFLAMELVRGSTLTEEIARGLSPLRVVELGAAAADGLAAAHREHVTHRDLKPDNIMIDRDGRPKILDFGLAKVAGDAPSPDDETVLRDDTTTRMGTILGTVAYMSPEQAQGQTVGLRSDIFSLGIVLYEMTTGRRPFTGENSTSILTSILRDTPEPVTKLEPSVPDALAKIIRRCLEKKPEDRFDDASVLHADLCELRDQLVSNPGQSGLPPRASRYRLLAAAAVIIALFSFLGNLWLKREARLQWLNEEALPRLQSLTDDIQGLQEGRESWDAYVLARQIEEVAPDSVVLGRLRPEFTRAISITSDPPGAKVFARYYDEPDADPLYIGTTPIEEVAYPAGITRIRFELEGRPPVEDIVWNLGYFAGDTIEGRFHDESLVPEDMAFVPTGEFPVFMPGLDHLAPEPTSAFLMDRHEVTNCEFKEFVDAGGYGNREYWTGPFVEDGREMTWDEAMTRFIDRAGRPGPATWEVGAYRDGQDDYPVSGVSWYEAAAYAKWAGKSLPTIFHWNRVAYTIVSSRIVPMANLSATGPVPVGKMKSANRYGVEDLAGNVREWIWNDSDRYGRFILGGGWNDPDYAFVDAYAQPPFDRSPTNGFRCIRMLDEEPNLGNLQRTIETPYRDFMSETPVPDEVFAHYLRQFDYDRTPLDATIEEEIPVDDGVRQKLTFDAAYGDERMIAYLFLPSTGTAPYQAVVIFPGSGSIQARSSESLRLSRLDFILRSGRAVLWPIYKGTYERSDELSSDYPEKTNFYKDHVIMWGKDLARSIDYLETREDIDSEKLAYYGLSWGGAMGAILPATEPRIKTNILYVAGLLFQHALPEADQINYVTRVRQPTLILNGELDFFFPTETSQKPLYELLGTADEDKKRLVFPGGHSVPRNEMMKESLQWLDTYLGPVE
jgi:serine/threonine protein kinase/dienelactone hydrolase